MRIQSPIAGAMTGSAGRMIFQHYHGRTYARAFPSVFHYQPTPAQAAAQNKYYGVRGQWRPLYGNMMPYVPADMLKQANAYNDLTKAIYSALGTFDAGQVAQPVRKFGFDPYNRLTLRLGNYDLYFQDPYYYITFYDFDYLTDVDFNPLFGHALYLNSDLQQLQYCVIPYDSDHLTFIFDNSNDWFPDHDFDMYVAISDEQFFSNFFY